MIKPNPFAPVFVSDLIANAPKLPASPPASAPPPRIPTLKELRCAEILTAAREGYISPGEAEEQIEAFEVVSPLFRPEGIFDPFHPAQTEWDPMETVAWAARRDKEFVRINSNAMRRGVSEWLPVYDVNFRVQGFEPALVPFVTLSSLEHSHGTCISNAISEMHEYLVGAGSCTTKNGRTASGNLIASGYRLPEKAHTEIGPREWYQLKAGGNGVHEITGRSYARHPIGSGGYYDITVQRADVLRLWPETAESRNARIGARLFSKLVKAMTCAKEYYPGRQPPGWTRDAFKKKAMRETGCNSSVFDREWKNAIDAAKPDWIGGAPKKGENPVPLPLLG